MARPSPSCAHGDDRLHFSPASPPSSNSAEKKESTGPRLNQLCPPSAQPSSNFSLDYRLTPPERLHMTNEPVDRRFLQGASGTKSPYGIRSWKYFSTRVSPAGTLIANASPFAILNSTM